ncbi:MAG: response regulator transcription factor [Dehalococcoidia bacterium]
MPATVLIIEDDPAIRDVLAYHLERAGHTVLTAGDGVSGLEQARHEAPDLLIVDLMLPRMSGSDVIRQVRSESNVGVLVISARGDVADRVAGIECGADDYIGKPFSVHEVLARVRALLRRARRTEEQGAHTRGAQGAAPTIAVDERAHEVRRQGELVELAPREFALLSFLVRHPRQVFSRDTLLNTVWGYDYVGDTRTVDVHVYWLRQKLEPHPAHPRHLVTVRRAGYRFEP